MERSNQNFDELQKLLALKRCEQPPRSFFTGFPDQVADRLHDPSPTRPLSWSERFGLDSPFRPVWFCALGVTVCGLLAAGTYYALHVPRDAKSGTATPIANAPLNSPALTAEPLPGTAPARDTRSSVEPVSSPNASSIENLQLTPSTRKPPAPAPPAKP